MLSIIRGTTPTIEYTFNTVNVGDIVTAYLTIMQRGRMIIEKNLSQATIGEKSLSYSLSQEETLSLAIGKANVMHNFVLGDGTRGASDNNSVEILLNHVNEVI